MLDLFNQNKIVNSKVHMITGAKGATLLYINTLSFLSSGLCTECNNILSVSGLNASSFWAKNSQEHTMYWSSRNMGSSHEIIPWTAGGNDPNPWLELELSDKRTITGKHVQTRIYI